MRTQKTVVLFVLTTLAAGYALAAGQGCVAAPKATTAATTTAGQDVAALKAELEAKTSLVAKLQAKAALLDKSRNYGDGSKVSGGAGWVALTAIAMMGSHIVHWKMARRAERKVRAGL